MTNRDNPRIPGSRRLKNTAERDQKAAELWVKGWGGQRIADELGFATRDNVSDAITRAFREQPVSDIDELRRRENLKLDVLESKLWEITDRRHYVCASGTGQLIRGPDGEPMIDDQPVTAAVDGLRKLLERRARLNGLDHSRLGKLSVENMNLVDINTVIAAKERELEFRKLSAIPEQPATRAAIEAGTPQASNFRTLS